MKRKRPSNDQELVTVAERVDDAATPTKLAARHLFAPPGALGLIADRAVCRLQARTTGLWLEPCEIRL